MNLRGYLTNKVYWPLVQKIKGENAQEVFKKLLKTQYLSKDELKYRQWQKVKALVRHATLNTPFYRDHFKGFLSEINSGAYHYSDFLSLPYTYKEDLQNYIDSLLWPNYSGRVTSGRTSGSTGKGLHLYYSSEHESYSEAARWRGKSWWGIFPGDPHMSIWGRHYGSRMDRVFQKSKSLLMNNLLFSGFELEERNLNYMWRQMRQFKPTILYGYPSAIFNLANFMQEMRKPLDGVSLKVIMVTGESIPRWQKETIRKIFKCPLANEYGCSETGGFVYECPEGNWHISSELTFIEFLDTNGRPVDDSEEGEVYITHFRNHYMPLIRYKVGDVAGPVSGTCSCGRNLPLMQVSVAKETDVFSLSDGRRFSSKIFDYINMAVIKQFPESLIQFRVIQNNPDEFIVEFVPGKILSHEGQQLFMQLSRQQLGPKVQLHTKVVPNIEREHTGKLRYFISKVG